MERARIRILQFEILLLSCNRKEVIINYKNVLPIEKFLLLN